MKVLYEKRGGWNNPKSAENGKKGGRPKKRIVVPIERDNKK